MKIAFLGLGIMGNAMAKKLLPLQNELRVWNRSKGKADALIKNGAKEVTSIVEVVQDVDAIFTMLSNPQAIENIALGNDGFLKHAKPNSLWVNTSTVNPSFAIHMKEQAALANVRYLDAPVSGSKVPAENGELTFLVGGDQVDLEQVRPLLLTMGKNIHHLGETGKGSAMKMVLNLMLGQAMLAFSEAILLGSSSGLSKETMFSILLGGPIAPAFLQNKKSKLEKEDYNPEFPLQLLHKDFHLIAQTAYESGISLPLTAIAKEVYALAKASGKGDQDFSVIYSFVQNNSLIKNSM